VCKPTLLLDWTGVIMAWHLHGVLSEEFQSILPWDPLMSSNLMWICQGHRLRSWRTQEDLFTESRIRGTIDLSPAWYQQG
ncbi:hypothetical protein PAXRUDRAFT_47813, partial [Paxillus rubicundulus Ve08.2h10]